MVSNAPVLVGEESAFSWNSCEGDGKLFPIRHNPCVQIYVNVISHEYE